MPTVVVSVMKATTAPKTKGMGRLANNSTRSIATPMKKLVIIAYSTSDRHEIDLFFAGHDESPVRKFNGRKNGH